VSVFLVGLVAVGVVIMVFAINVGLVLDARSGAQAAADAAALGAAPLTFAEFGSTLSPKAEAARLAEANGAALLSCICEMNTSWKSRIVEVTVAVSRPIPGFGKAQVRASARAQFSPVEALGR
jgi:hypothetical protein